MRPKLIKGDLHEDGRGKLYYNNFFDASQIKRIYSIENNDENYLRGWKGHQVENRWFLCSKGKIFISVCSLDCFQTKTPKINLFTLNENEFNILFVPFGYATLVQSGEINSKIICMSDYFLNSSNDENLRWDSNFFDK